MIRRALAWFQYRFDELFSRGAWGKFLLLALFTGVLLVVGMAAQLVGLFGPENEKVSGIRRDLDGGPLDALFWAFHHILDPSFFSESYGATIPVLLISLLIAFGGMTVFAILVGMISAIMEERLDVLRRGDSAVQERGHILILGWNPQAPRIIQLLAEHRHRPCIVVLAPGEPDGMREALREYGADTVAAKVVLRSGAPANPIELARVASAAAAGIIVLPDAGEPPITADAGVVRTLLVLAGIPWPDQRPKIVAEVGQARHAEVARLAARGTVPVVATGEVVALLLFQCSRQRGISRVFEAIIAPQGAGILVRPAPDCTDLTFGELAYAYRQSVVLGLSRRDGEVDGVPRYQHVLNPPRHRRLAADEWLILLARGEETPRLDQDLGHQSSVAVNQTRLGGADDDVGTDPAAARFHAQVSTGRALLAPSAWRVLIIGWNDHLADLLLEYDQCQGPPAGIVIASAVDAAGAGERLELSGTVLCRIAPEYRRLDALLPGAVANLAPETFDAVVVLADGSWADPDPDARTVMTLVLLRERLRFTGGRPRLAAELLADAAAEAAADLGIDDLVVGSRLISQQLVQIAQQSMVAAVFDDLLSSGGMDLYLKPVARYVQTGVLVTFRDLVYSAQHLSEVVLGIWLAQPRPGWPAGLHLAPDQAFAWTFEAEDQVVVCAEELYDVPATGTATIRKG